jgi:hypothetical protein
MRSVIFIFLLFAATTSMAQSSHTFVPTHSGIYLPGDYQGWAPSTAPSLVFDSSTDVWVADSVMFPSDTVQMKFTDAPDWSHTNYGLDTAYTHTDTSGRASDSVGSAGNIQIILSAPGAYAVLLNDSSYVYDVITRSALAAEGVSQIVKTSVHVWPNPATDEITVTTGLHMNKLTITDLTGKKVLQQQLNGKEQHAINVASLPAGVYIVTLSGTDGSSSTKLTIQR